MNKKQVQDALAKLRDTKDDPDICRSLAERLLAHLTGNKATRDSSGPSKAEVIAALQPHAIKQAKEWIKRIQGQAPGYVLWVIKRIKSDIGSGLYTWAQINCSADSLEKMYQRQLTINRALCVGQHKQEIVDLQRSPKPRTLVDEIVYGIRHSVNKGDATWPELGLTPNDLENIASKCASAYSSTAQKKAKAS